MLERIDGDPPNREREGPISKKDLRALVFKIIPSEFETPFPKDSILFSPVQTALLSFFTDRAEKRFKAEKKFNRNNENSQPEIDCNGQPLWWQELMINEDFRTGYTSTEDCSVLKFHPSGRSPFDN